MPLAWDERKRLLRVAGLAEELLGAAQASGERSARESLDEQVGFLMREVRELLAASDPAIGEEFERLMMREPTTPIPPELRTAALVGWLRSELAAEMIDEQREQEAALRPPPRRKQTVGFKIRSPITREHPIPEEPASE